MKAKFSKSSAIVLATVLLRSMFLSSSVSMSVEDVADTTGYPAASGGGYDPYADINDDGLSILRTFLG